MHSELQALYPFLTRRAPDRGALERARGSREAHS
jgi:hypothetical protein